MKTDNDTMTGAERLVLAAGAGLLPFFLFGTCGWASMPDATSGEPSLPSVKMVPKKLALFKNGYGTVTLEGKTAEGSSMELAGLPHSFLRIILAFRRAGRFRPGIDQQQGEGNHPQAGIRQE